MADIAFHHGTRVFESQEVPVLIRTLQSAVIAHVGTAPGADPSVFPLNTPVLIKGAAEYSKAALLGDAGTLKSSLDGSFDQAATYNYVVRVAEVVNQAATLSNLVGDGPTRTGVHALLKCESLFGRKLKPRLVVVPGYTSSLATDGIAAANVTNGGAGYTTAPTVAITGDGQGAEAIALVASGLVMAVVVTKPGWGYTTAAVAFSGGGGAGAAATATIGTVANPVVAELPGVLEKLRAVALVDGPDTTDEAAVTWRETINSDRIYPIDVKHQVWDTTLSAYVPRPASPRFAGVQAKVDKQSGFWWSLSNKPINGIGGVSRPIVYGDQTNYLNENHVNTTINLGEGWVTWGNRVATGIDLNKFMSVRRTMDFINEALEAAYLEFVDKPFSLANLKFMIESGNAFMKVLRAEGAILGGRVWLDPERNTNEEMAQGRVTLGVDFEPPAPMEDIRMITHRNISYYADLRERVLEEIREGALAAAAA